MTADHGNGGAIMTAMAERITKKLEDALTPQRLRVIDESHQHQGHGGWREGGETHFRVDIVSAAFVGKSRLERHRLVNAALVQELAERVHALAIVARAPGEI
jgi:BolA protein